MTPPTALGPATLAFSALRGGEEPSRSPGEVGPNGLSDAQLIALARESRDEAFELLYAAYKGRIYTFLLRFLADPEAADDVTQETFTKAYGALHTLSAEHKVLPWLYRVASNAALDGIRRRRRFPWVRLGGLTGTSGEPHARDEHGRVSEREHVQAVLRAIPAENAIALLLHALEGYSYKEIAAIQGVTMTAVRSRIARAREAFRERYPEK